MLLIYVWEVAGEIQQNVETEITLGLCMEVQQAMKLRPCFFNVQLA